MSGSSNGPTLEASLTIQDTGIKAGGGDGSRAVDGWFVLFGTRGLFMTGHRLGELWRRVGFVFRLAPYFPGEFQVFFNPVEVRGQK